MNGSTFLIVLVLFIGIAMLYIGVTGKATQFVKAVTA